MNIDNAIFTELERLKVKLDAGEELTEEEQKWANDILSEVIEMVQAFAEALIEAFKPFVETLLKIAEEWRERVD